MAMHSRPSHHLAGNPGGCKGAARASSERLEALLYSPSLPGWDEVKLAPEVGLGVTVVEQGRALVLRGGVPMGAAPPPYDFTWSFALGEQPGGTTRLLVRERYAYSRWWARLLVEPVAAVSFLMTQRMLRGIRDRAERDRGPGA